MATKHLPGERFLAMVLWWKGCSEAEIVRRTGFVSKAVFRGIRNREANGMKPRSEMSIAERQSILDRMRAEQPEGAMALQSDFGASPLDDRQCVRVRRREADGRVRLVEYGGSKPGRGRKANPVPVLPAAAAPPPPSSPQKVRPIAPGRDGQYLETYEVNRREMGGMMRWNAAVDQVELLRSRGMLADPQKRQSADHEIKASLWAGQRRFEIARMIQSLRERAGYEAGLQSIDFGKETRGQGGSFDPSVAIFEARADLADIASLMPQRSWRLIECLISPGGIPGLVPPKGGSKGARRRPEVMRARRELQQEVWLALDYAATWWKSGRAGSGGAHFPLLPVSDFRARWPNSIWRAT